MDFNSTSAVLYAAALWFLGALIVWGIPMAMIALSRLFREWQARKARDSLPGHRNGTHRNPPLSPDPVG
jgi:TRAP-type C4-dicarboxylate transport system permease small subunit